jgi:GNAT superfamily N-acetyltransferase
MSDLLQHLETYYDTVPRPHARVAECGPFTLFLGEPGGWTFYARPRLGGTDPFTVVDVKAALARLREEGLPEAIEWVHETTPDLLAAVRAEGTLSVEEVPLLVLGDERPRPGPVGDDVRIRILTPDDGDLLAEANACAHVGFGSRGTAVGTDGVTERDAARKLPQQRVLDLIASGDAIVAVAETADGVVCTGRAIPVGGVAEIVGVATLPVARRRGIGAALTAALVDAALAADVRTLFLTASSADVARVYESVGFGRVGTGYIAEAGGH